MTDPLALALPEHRPVRLLALGAHADDIEIGAGGTILRLGARSAGLEARWVVLSADEERAAEAGVAAAAFAPGAEVRLGGLRDAWFPADFGAAKGTLLAAIDGFEPDLVFAPSLHDRHQDHRLLAELAWQVLRSHAIWEYEIPKYEGDLRDPNLFVRLPSSLAHRKVELLLSCFPSQASRAWFDREVFLGVMRLRGLEAKAPDGYAEAFHARKIAV
jgi:LmbE family N-acetylglucosaminyl deacetylase